MDEYEVYARFYDLDLADRHDDLLLFQQFSTRCGSPILELGCGTGRLLVPLARAGFEVTGLDISPAMLDRARRKVAAEHLEDRVTLIEQDIREFDLEARFNLAFSAVNSFMHLLTLNDQLAALTRICHHLNPGGLVVLDLFNPDLGRLSEPAGQVHLERTMLDPATGCRVMKFHTRRVDLGRQLLHVTYIIDEVDALGLVRRTLFPFTLRYLFRAELELLLRCAGLEVEAIYGSSDLDEFTGESERLIAVARRPN